MNKIKIIIIFIGITIIHYIFQFVAWSIVDSPFFGVTTKIIWDRIFLILFLPVNGILPNSIIDRHFDILIILNSMTWGIFVSAIIYYFIGTKRK